MDARLFVPSLLNRLVEVGRDPSVLIVDSYAYRHKPKVRFLADADRLTEYDVIMFSPTRRGLSGTSSERLFEEVSIDVLQAWQAILSERQRELWQFLERGGVLIVFVEPLGGFTLRHTEGLMALELVSPKWKLTAMRWTNDKGTSLEVLDPDHPLSGYLQRVSGWTATIAGGVLADDPHGYPLALSRDGQILAYAEHVERGSIYWLPRPSSEEQWDLLLDSAARIWSDETDPLMGLASSELQQIVEQQDALRQRIARETAALENSRQGILERRRRLVDEDRAVERSLQHYRAAQVAAPARALDFWHRMLEVIEHEFGGEHKAREVLQYSKGTGDAITNPANNKTYRARHEGGEGKQVPPEVLEKASTAAREILLKFLEERSRSLDAGHGGSAPQP